MSSSGFVEVDAVVSGSGELDVVSEDLNCTEFDSYDPFFTSIAIIRAVVGSFSVVCCLLVIFLIVLFKKYKFFTQRLILYLAVAAFLHSLSYPLARVNYYSPRPLFDPYCYFGGLFNLYTSWLEVLALTCLTFNVFLNAVLDKWPQNVEYYYIAFTILTPLIWTWIPLIDKTFANGAAWCDIRTINEDCTSHTFGAFARFILWYIPLAVVLIVLCVMAVVAAYMIKKRNKIWYGPFTSKQQQAEIKLQKEVKPMIWYPVVYLLLNIFSFINRLDIALNPGDSIIFFWYLHIITSPLRGAFVAVVFALDPETRKRLSPREIRAAVTTVFYRKDRAKSVTSYYVVERSRGETLGGGGYIQTANSPLTSPYVQDSMS